MTRKTRAAPPKQAKRTRSGRESRARFPDLRGPKPLLPLETENALTPRQLEILDLLEGSVLKMSFADVTMAETAKLAGCSLRTLYEIAPSKDELTQIVLDRRLHRIGREAMQALELEGTPLVRLRAYLEATNRALQPTTALFSRDFARKPDVRRLVDRHGAYIISITRALLDEAVEQGEIPPMNTAAVAHVLGGLGAEFSRSKVAATLDGSPKEAADFVAGLLFAGLTQRT